MEERESAQDCLQNLDAYIRLLEAENRRFAANLSEARKALKNIEAFLGPSNSDMDSMDRPELFGLIWHMWQIAYEALAGEEE